MASLVLGVVGGVIGGVIGGPIGAQIGFMAGAAIGGYVDMQLNKQEAQGPRLQDRTVQSSAYGAMLPITHGTIGLAGNVIWAPDLVELSHTEELGGKGGGSSPIVEQTVYDYYANFAVSLGEGVVSRVLRIWANGKLWYDANGASKGYTNWRLYPGDETQMPDPTMEAYDGAGNTPAYRGQAYVVFPMLPVREFNNALPYLFFEIAHSSTVTGSVATLTDAAVATNREPDSIVYGSDGTLYWYRKAIAGAQNIFRIDPSTGAILSNWTPAVAAGTNQPFLTITIPIPGGVFWGAANTLAFAGNSTGIVATALINPNANAITFPTAMDTSNGGYVRAGVDPAPLGDDLLMMDIYDTLNLNLARFIRISLQQMRVIAQSPTFGLVSQESNQSGFTIAWGPWNQQTIATNPLAQGATDGTYYYATAVIRSNAYRIYRFDVGTGQLVSQHDQPAGNRKAYGLLYAKGKLYVAADGTLDQWDTATMTLAASYVMPGPGGTAGTTAAKTLGWTLENKLLYSGASDNSALVMDLDNFGSAGAAMITIAHSAGVGVGVYGRDPIGAARLMGAQHLGPAARYYLYALSTGIADGPAALPDVLANYMNRTGLSASDYDTSALNAYNVRGSLVARQMAARDAISSLTQAYFFDGIESDAKIKYVPRGVNAPIVIPSSALAGVADDIPALAIKRKQDVDLPRTVNVNYLDPAFDYQSNSQYARRLAGSSSSDLTVEVALALVADEAKAIAETWLYNAWAERAVFSYATTRKYLALEPTDLTQVKGFVMRLNKRTEDGGLLRWEGAGDASQIYVQDAAGQEAQGGAQTTPEVHPTQVLYLDIPLLRDADDHPGFYLAANGTPPAGWPGAAIYKSIDEGRNYFAYYAVTGPATFGNATSVLGSWDARTHIFDEGNSVTVQLNGALNSATEADVLNGANYILIGSEVLQFKLATAIDATTFTLSGLLRGQEGTEWAVATHAIGDQVVLLNTNLRDTTHDQSETNVARYFKSVTFGLPLELGTTRVFNNTGVRQKPYAPVHVGGGRLGNNDWSLQWDRRTRLSDGWQDLIDAPLGEATELYEVDIMQSTTVKRTLTGLTTPTAIYPLAQQNTDFGGVQGTLSVRVYQISATVGRGYPAAATLTS